jgi:DNA-nicking Smr family endonuclease
MQAQQTEIMILSDKEQSFLFRQIEKNMRKWKRKQIQVCESQKMKAGMFVPETQNINPCPVSSF